MASVTDRGERFADTGSKTKPNQTKNLKKKLGKDAPAGDADALGQVLQLVGQPALFDDARIGDGDLAQTEKNKNPDDEHRFEPTIQKFPSTKTKELGQS